VKLLKLNDSYINPSFISDIRVDSERTMRIRMSGGHIINIEGETEVTAVKAWLVKNCQDLMQGKPSSRVFSDYLDDE
jgi:hypothetical protein